MNKYAIALGVFVAVLVFVFAVRAAAQAGIGG